MQSNKEKMIDARSFVEIYRSMTDNEKALLRDSLMQSLGVTYQTIWNWATGKCVPAIPGVKKQISKSVNLVLNVKTSVDTLFKNQLN